MTAPRARPLADSLGLAGRHCCTSAWGACEMRPGHARDRLSDNGHGDDDSGDEVMATVAAMITMATMMAVTMVMRLLMAMMTVMMAMVVCLVTAMTLTLMTTMAARMRMRIAKTTRSEPACMQLRSGAKTEQP